MQSNVKPAAESARTNVLRVRRRVFALLGLGTVWAGGTVTSCKSTTASTEGLVTAPMLAASEEVASAEQDAGDAGRDSASARAMTEPRPPPGLTSCTRAVHCEDPMLAAAAWPYPHPFERCDPDPPGDAGAFSANATTEKRRDDPETCCYVSFRDCVRRGGRPHVVRGRPLRTDEGDPVLAPPRAGGAWAAGWTELASRAEGDDGADEWLEAAALEHASVAEFARLSLALLALGAPATLVERTHVAALDEIEHARVCYAEASRRLGRPIGPGPLPLQHRGLGASTDVEGLAKATLIDGCLGECVSAIVLRERDLSDMAADEERHAELAWEILEFLLSVEPRAARAGIELALAEIDARCSSPDDLSAAVMRDVVRPGAAGLMARYCT